jgi:hypothetical protein
MTTAKRSTEAAEDSRAEDELTRSRQQLAELQSKLSKM